MNSVAPQYTLSGNFCIACKSWSTTTSHHLFPKDECLRKKWLDILELSASDIKRTSRVCAEHFNKQCFSLTAATRPRLLPGSLPNLLPKYNTIQNKPNRSNKEEHVEEVPNFPSMSYDVPTLSECYDQSPQFITEPHIFIKGEPTTEIVGSQLPDYEPVTEEPTKRMCYVGDIKKVEDFSTPTKAKRNYDIIKKTLQHQKRKIKTLQQSNRRLRNKMSSLKELLRHLKSKKMISEEAEQVLQNRTSDTLHEIWKRNLRSHDKTYSPELINFAIALQFYSAKAYNYVRKCFKKILPHPATISRLQIVWSMVNLGLLKKLLKQYN